MRFFLSNLDVVLAIGAIGLMLLVIGLWARRRKTHPRCAKCEFDLSGLFDSQQPRVTECPECGSSITAYLGIRSTAFRRRWWLIGLGLFFFTVSLIALEPHLKLISKINLYPVASDGYLIRNAGSSGMGYVNEPNKAMAELRYRLAHNKLSTADIQLAVTTGLKAQSTQSAVSSVWCDFIEHAREKGLVNNADWLTYAQTACQPACFGNRSFSAAEVWLSPQNFGNAAYRSSGCNLFALATHVSTTVNGTAVQPKLTSNGIEFAISGSRSSEGTLIIPDLKPGKHIVTTTWSLQVFEKGQAPGSAPLFTKPVTTTTEVVVE